MAIWWVQARRRQGSDDDSTANPCQSLETARDGGRAGVHPDSPTWLCGAWTGHRAAGNTAVVRPGVPVCACSELLDPQMELGVLADCWGAGTPVLLNPLHARQLPFINPHLKSCWRLACTIGLGGLFHNLALLVAKIFLLIPISISIHGALTMTFPFSLLLQNLF